MSQQSSDHEQRLVLLNHWLNNQFGNNTFSLKPASNDASFRRYFRVYKDNQSYIAMDAPPNKESCAEFVEIAKLLESHKLHVPHIHIEDQTQGFLLLDDFGNDDYLSKLNAETVENLYTDAFDALYLMHSKVNGESLPEYDRKLLTNEMNLFSDWFLGKHLKLQLSENTRRNIQATYQLLADSALEQPKVFVHRDYHSRNLMLTQQNNPGILDFQDAVCGPITYDLVSLLRDCYISWPAAQVEKWMQQYYARLSLTGIVACELNTFRRWFDWMGLQRHLKAIGIFSRLNYRDGKPAYLQDIPRTYHYVNLVCRQYPELDDFSNCLHTLSIDEKLSK